MHHSKKIALVSNTSWSVYNFRLGLIKRLQKLGHDVTIIAPRDNFTAKLVSEGFSFHHIYTNNYSTNPLNDLRTINHLRKIYKKNNFDFIFHYTIKPNIYGTLAARWCNIPSVAITTGLGRLFSYNNKIVKSLSKRLYQVAARYSKQVWFLNESDLNTFIDKGITHKENTFLLPSEGINLQKFQPNRISQTEKTKTLTFLFAGRIIWDKGVKEYVEAAKTIKEKYPDINFQILGFVDPSNPNSVPYEYIQEWQRKKVITYLGETEDVRPFLEKSSCLIFPSFYNEGISRILLETAAMARPIITTDNVGCRDVVKDGYNGFICVPKDVTSLVQKIEQFIELTSSKKKLMGLNGRKVVVQNFDEEIIIQKYIDFLNSFFATEFAPNLKKKITVTNQHLKQIALPILNS